MADGERRNNNGKNQPHTFEWKIRLNDGSPFTSPSLPFQSKVSPFFRFCGFYCQLYCHPELTENGNLVVIGLKGYPAPYENTVSCYYSASLINIKGEEQFTEEGWIHSSGKAIHHVIFEDVQLGQLFGIESPFNLCFSWCELSGSAVSKHNNQAEPGLSAGMSTSVLECSTQTEDILFSCEVSSIDVSEQATQTEPTQHTSAGNADINNVNKTNKFLEILSKDLGNFYEGKIKPDCVLNVGQTKFPVHRSLLFARSEVFAAMFCHDTSESRSGEVDITDVDAAAFSDVIYYMYTGKVRELTPDTAASVYAVADKYALIELKEECLDFLMNNLTLEILCDAAVLSHSHAETQLEKKVVEFIKSKLRELMGCDTWKHFSDNHYKLANNLLCSALLASQTGKI